MTELHRPGLPASVLGLADYRADFAVRDAESIDHPSWKLERRQDFHEPGNASWEACLRGDWDEALQLLESRRPTLLKAVEEEEGRGNPFMRVRIVEEPLTPYVQWELASLRLQAECGRPVRVVHADKIDSLEEHELLPEVVVLGGRVLYQILYGRDGTAEGGVRYLDSVLALRWESFIRDLYADGEDVIEYADQHVSVLSLPVSEE